MRTHATTRRACALIATAVGLALIATGCATTDSGAAPEPSETTSAVGTSPAPSTPEPTPTPTPTFDPADTSTWAITFTSVGPFTIGADQDAEADSVKASYSTDGHQPLGGDVVCPALFLSPVVNSKAPSFVTTYGSGPVGRTDLIALSGRADTPSSAAEKAASPSTDRGIRVGSTLDELRAAYPDVVKTGQYSDVNTYYGVENAEGRWLLFTVLDSGFIGTITLSSKKVPPSEYCG